MSQWKARDATNGPECKLGDTADYARRKAMSMAEAERWLAPVLNYVPASAPEAAAAAE